LFAGPLNPEHLLFADHADVSRYILIPERVKWKSGSQIYVDLCCEFSDSVVDVTTHCGRPGIGQ